MHSTYYFLMQSSGERIPYYRRVFYYKQQAYHSIAYCLTSAITIGLVHCKSHRTDQSLITIGNNRADNAAKQAALSSDKPHICHMQKTTSSLMPPTKPLLTCLHKLSIPTHKLSNSS